MMLAVSLPQYDPTHVMFSEKTKNNVLNTGDFYRLYYSDSDVSTNGLILFFKLRKVGIERYFNKIKCCFTNSENRNTIGFIKAIEKSILALMPEGRSKRQVMRIEEQLNHGFIKIFSDSKASFGQHDELQLLLKISGIWSNNGEYGVTFRFFFNPE